jgi:hypothetical protein
VLKIGLDGNGDHVNERRKEAGHAREEARERQEREAVRGAPEEGYAEGPSGEDREHSQRLEEGRQEVGRQAEEVIRQDEEEILMPDA